MAFSAAALAFMAAGCDNEYEASHLDEFQVSQSYVSLPVSGGTKEVTLTAKTDWALSASIDSLDFEYPSWLTVSPTSGTSGETALKFTVEADEDAANSTVLYIIETENGEMKKYGKVQMLNIIQGVQGDVEVSTCEEIIAGPDSKTYRATGTVTGISNTTYGNWYLTDDTGTIYIYGTLDASGAAKNFSSLGIAVGDVVTVQGPKTTYGTTVELVDVTVIEIVKSLLVLDPTEVSVGSSASDFTVKAVVSGDTFNFESNADWLAVKSVSEEGDTTFVNVHVLENTSSEARAGVITFTSSTESAASSIDLSVVQSGLKGTTPDNPYTVAEAVAAIKAGTAGSNNVYVKGIVCTVDNVSTSYGNAQYWISDDGGTDGDMLEAYRGYYFDGAKFTSEDQIMTGWEVIVCGTLTVYNGVYEFNKNNYIYSIEGATAAYSVADAITAITTNCPSDKVLVSGVISEISSVSTSYGNATYYISDDGTTTSQLQVFRGKWFGGDKFTAEDQIKVGDKVTVVGNVVYYNSKTPEVNSGNYIIALNGKSSAE